jgi:hypothetical protein
MVNNTMTNNPNKTKCWLKKYNFIKYVRGIARKIIAKYKRWSLTELNIPYKLKNSP